MTSTFESVIEDGFAPNCPLCLEPMEPRVGAWRCEECQVAIRTEA